ncbi:hypothetical protein [Zavarzinella formosa]|uniref:hypothetical protein n=1 Tax=Zavarzinella formosa TaxID=360055 RepID=UPI00031E12AB|nr:hypothetical protein [Zavarzinella formosa]
MRVITETDQKLVARHSVREFIHWNRLPVIFIIGLIVVPLLSPHHLALFLKISSALIFTAILGLLSFPAVTITLERVAGQVRVERRAWFRRSVWAAPLAGLIDIEIENVEGRKIEHIEGRKSFVSQPVLLFEKARREPIFIKDTTTKLEQVQAAVRQYLCRSVCG